MLTDVLLTLGYRVRIMDNFLYDHFHVAEWLITRPRTSLMVEDLRDVHALDQTLDGITDVVLLASLVGDPISRKYPDLARAVNLEGSTALFDALAGRGLRRFVFTSTCSNYGLWEARAGHRDRAADAAVDLRRNKGRLRAGDAGAARIG